MHNAQVHSLRQAARLITSNYRPEPAAIPEKRWLGWCNNATAHPFAGNCEAGLDSVPGSLPFPRESRLANAACYNSGPLHPGGTPFFTTLYSAQLTWLNKLRFGRLRSSNK